MQRNAKKSVPFILGTVQRATANAVGFLSRATADAVLYLNQNQSERLPDDFLNSLPRPVQVAIAERMRARAG
jgi:hypothetical protein